MVTIAVGNRKGGVGKTTTAEAIASYLSRNGARVLLIDLDAQCNLSSYLDVDVNDGNIGDVLKEKGGIGLKDIIVKTDLCDVAPGSLELSSIADGLLQKTGREKRLAEELRAVCDVYEYVVVDMPPDVGLLSMNALTAADYLVAVSNADAFSLDGIVQLHSAVEDAVEYTNPKLKVAGILITMFDKRTVISSVMAEQLKDLAGQMGSTVFDARIRRCVAVREAQTQRQDLYAYAPKCTAAVDYEAWMQEELVEVLKNG